MSLENYRNQYNQIPSSQIVYEHNPVYYSEEIKESTNQRDEEEEKVSKESSVVA
jgi:hypothetical protein